MTANWDDVRIFLAVHRKGSHAGAARSLAVDPTTVGRRIAALEQAMGATLFQRSRSGLSTTQAGSRLARHAEQMEAEMLASERELRGAESDLEGDVRVTAGDGVVTSLLVPALADLLSWHPGLRVEFCGGSGQLDLSRREADVALRLSRPKEPSLVRRRLGVVPFRLFASEAYLARRGTPTTVEALADHDFILYDALLERSPPMVWLRSHAGPTARLRCNLTAIVAAACAAGHGIALAIPTVMRGLPGVKEVLRHVEIPTRELWAVVHTDMRQNRRVKAVLDWMASAVAAAGIRSGER